MKRVCLQRSSLIRNWKKPELWQKPAFIFKYADFKQCEQTLRRKNRWHLWPERNYDPWQSSRRNTVVWFGSWLYRLRETPTSALLTRIHLSLDEIQQKSDLPPSPPAANPSSSHAESDDVRTTMLRAKLKEMEEAGAETLGLRHMLQTFVMPRHE